MSLSPWDLGGISFDFDLYRPRRPSYLYATQVGRRRNESYRVATKAEAVETDERGPDFIEGMVQKKRKDSYKRATRQDDIEMDNITNMIRANHVSIPEESPASVDTNITILGHPQPLNSSSVLMSQSVESGSAPPTDDETVASTITEVDIGVDLTRDTWRYRRNMIVITFSFIMVFSAFRAIQNLQSSLNTQGRLGVIAMACVHGTMFLTCLFAPVLINKLTSKWTIVLGLLFYLFWIVANFYPHFYTLIPTSIGVGFGQSLAWSAQVTYVSKLALDYAHLSRQVSDQEAYRFNGIFLACFQTSHIWGNLVSSLVLRNSEIAGTSAGGGTSAEEEAAFGVFCGGYDLCEEEVPKFWNISNIAVTSASNSVLKLIGSYLVFAFLGFILILFFLEKIGAKSDPEKPCLQLVWQNVHQMCTHKTYRLLIPMLIFNGFEQGFVYTDYNKSFIMCTLGIEWIGYNMITLGMANAVSSVLVGMLSRHIPREAIIGTGFVLHIGLMVFLLIWIPDNSLVPIFFVISALWGVCDAVWQTQCNILVNVSCPEDRDTAFSNFRMLQGFGAALAFFLGAFVCVAVKLYIIIGLLTLSILCCAIAEYRIRQVDY